MTLLNVENLTHRYFGNPELVLDGISFGVNRREIFALVGPSGCGKTTTLRALAGFERPLSGQISLDGQIVEGNRVHVPPERRGIGFVFQDYALFPHLNVLENVMFGLHVHPRPRRRVMAVEVLWMLGLAGMEHRRVQQLSGGQQQRVALARAIAPSPRLVLLDEPFSNLDAELRHATRQELRAIVENTGTSALLVTHDQEEALSVAHRIAVMCNGRLEQVGPTEEVYNHPRTAFVAQFLGRTNLIEGKGIGCCAETTLGRIELDRPREGQVLISMRPEHLSLEPVDEKFPAGTVVAREFKGHDMTYRVRHGRDEYLIQTDYRCQFQPGQSVRLKPSAQAAVLDDSPE